MSNDEISQKEVWLRFACSALPAALRIEHMAGMAYNPFSESARAADGMMQEWEKRHGMLKDILNGITSCEVCTKQVGDEQVGGVIVTRNRSGYFIKLCGNPECTELFLKQQKEESEVQANIEIAKTNVETNVETRDTGG